MHTSEFLGDRVLRAVLLLRQPLDSPDIRKKLADLLLDVLAVLLGLDSRMQMQINKRCLRWIEKQSQRLAVQAGQSLNN
jgi:NTP pyrophosphatase (non-canonical NTP hydrolase)